MRVWAVSYYIMVPIRLIVFDMLAIQAYSLTNTNPIVSICSALTVTDLSAHSLRLWDHN